MRLFILPALVLVGALIGCGQGDSTGVRISERGMYINTADNYKKDTEKAIVEHYAKDLGPHWAMSVELSPVPRLIEGRRENEGEFRWREVNAAVTLTGTGLQAEAPVAEPQMRNEIEELLRKLQTPPGGPIVVTFTRTVATIDRPVAAIAQPVVPQGGAAQRTYVIQAGDTLADISSVFYGSPAHWRVLVTANPGLDPASLPAGLSIIIPAKP